MTFSRKAKMNDAFAISLATAKANSAQAHKRMQEAERLRDELRRKATALRRAFESLEVIWGINPAVLNQARTNFEAALDAAHAQGERAERRQGEYDEAEEAVERVRQAAVYATVVNRQRRQ
jgi:DNA repair exonuclease SbcCD ATPase subunit